MSGSREVLERLADEVSARFTAEKRVLSFEEYLEELLQHPLRHTRDAARYLRDCFDCYGTYELERPHGTVRRFRLFDQEFVEQGIGAARVRLSGHEGLQNSFYRALSNFAREGRANRLLLLHGPNGSAKSTFAACVMRALEHYSSLDEGALYRFSWVFSRKVEERSIGFGSGKRSEREDSYAHLDHASVDSKLTSELREHPLLLLPIEQRRELLSSSYEAAKESPPDWLWQGRLGRKNAQILDALLQSYNGDLKRVLAHVQVERFYISRRYRTGVVTIGPQMSVDASERQITADRSLMDLPPALGALSLYETQGELVDGECGLIEYSDLLKRPLDAWKYLLLAIESGEVALAMSMLTVNSVLIASTNEGHLEAFRQHPEYNSFRARISLLRVGYLLDYQHEQEIYDAQIVPQVRRHVAPHTTHVAALWAVLTRLLPSSPDHYDDPALGRIAADLRPMEKAKLYAEGAIPRRLDSEQAKLLRAGIAAVAHEFDNLPSYEGRQGASPREVRTLLLDAAQHTLHRCLSPLAVFDQIEILCEEGDYDFLQMQPNNNYHDARGFIVQVKSVWLEMFDREMRSSTGLVEESRQEELFERYIHHVSLWVKGERHRDEVTGDFVDPDQRLMNRIEDILDVENPDEFRRNLINMIAAHAIDHPGEKVDHLLIFPRYLERIREAYYDERRTQMATIVADMLAVLSDNGQNLERDERTKAQASVERLCSDFGYCRDCARESLGELLRERYR